ncbi:hypothetical protein G6L97_15235 [Agrobacterium tumefaciens]|uniref:hypothetical protein n=1 Tax=Agrobacterium tumefaciens TaxID=358 RepID=UPI001571F884|nr:hypothetical protein [Agrobacterium tumefaciens]MCP2137545.1 hypothetical protein [Rhizobium sp. SLBN-94]NSZ85523.1 hypothetical protein [Agrobacterium tumefaciens]WCA70759.1 hypothetical protein G6L97_15235 [Agrobacterium tumefaciens]
MDGNTLVVGIKPFLHRFAIERTGEMEIEGSYSESDDMWVVATPSGSRPLIDLAGSQVEVLTKTMTQQEADDEKRLSMLELATKSDGVQESDDRAASPAMTLELATKTHAQMESDDTRASEKLLV